ncbi:hypothetical protein LguiB_028718 [Lonicera macranthoides]
MEYLFNSINKAVNEQIWEGLKPSKGGPVISHLLFVGDLILFTKANDKNVRCVMEILDELCCVSGEKVKFHKSKIFFAPRVLRRNVNALSHLCGMTHTEDLGRYLGFPLVHGRTKRKHFNHNIEKIQNKLSGWKANTLFFASRATIV